MADIRKTTVVMDDFNRSEDPLSNGGKWAIPDSRWSAMVATGSDATEKGSPTTVSEAYWTPTTFDGDEAEVWSTATGGGVGAEGVAWSLGLWYAPNVGGSNNISGYRFRREEGAGSPSFVLTRYIANAGVDLDTQDATGFGLGIYLLRRNGNDVEAWLSEDVGATWTMIVSATDTNFMTLLYLGIGISENSGSRNLGWDNFGGGGRRLHQQLYRIVRANRSYTNVVSA